jgi:hypothetical protein
MIYAYLAIDKRWFSLLPRPHPQTLILSVKVTQKCSMEQVPLFYALYAPNFLSWLTILMGMTSLNQQLQSLIYYKSSDKHAICCSSFHNSQPSLERILTLWLAVSSQVTTHNICWFCFMNDLLVSTSYDPGLSLAQWFHNPLMFRWKSHNHDLHGWKEGSHGMVVFSNQRECARYRE